MLQTLTEQLTNPQAQAKLWMLFNCIRKGCESHHFTKRHSKEWHVGGCQIMLTRLFARIINAFQSIGLKTSAWKGQILGQICKKRLLREPGHEFLCGSLMQWACPWVKVQSLKTTDCESQMTFNKEGSTSEWVYFMCFNLCLCRNFPSCFWCCQNEEWGGFYRLSWTFLPMDGNSLSLPSIFLACMHPWLEEWGSHAWVLQLKATSQWSKQRTKSSPSNCLTSVANWQLILQRSWMCKQSSWKQKSPSLQSGLQSIGISEWETKLKWHCCSTNEKVCSKRLITKNNDEATHEHCEASPQSLCGDKLAVKGGLTSLHLLSQTHPCGKSLKFHSHSSPKSTAKCVMGSHLPSEVQHSCGVIHPTQLSQGGGWVRKPNMREVKFSASESIPCASPRQTAWVICQVKVRFVQGIFSSLSIAEQETVAVAVTTNSNGESNFNSCFRNWCICNCMALTLLLLRESSQLLPFLPVSIARLVGFHLFKWIPFIMKWSEPFPHRAVGELSDWSHHQNECKSVQQKTSMTQMAIACSPLNLCHKPSEHHKLMSKCCITPVHSDSCGCIPTLASLAQGSQSIPFALAAETSIVHFSPFKGTHMESTRSKVWSVQPIGVNMWGQKWSPRWRCVLLGITAGPFFKGLLNSSQTVTAAPKTGSPGAVEKTPIPNRNFPGKCVKDASSKNASQPYLSLNVDEPNKYPSTRKAVKWRLFAQHQANCSCWYSTIKTKPKSSHKLFNQPCAQVSTKVNLTWPLHQPQSMHRPICTSGLSVNNTSISWPLFHSDDYW